MSRERQPITQRWVTMAIRAIVNVGLNLKTVRIDPTTGAVVADIANGTGGDSPDPIDAILDRRIAEQESARLGGANRAGGITKRKITK